MIPNVSYGSRTRGLLAYLFGPGRSDEHVDARIVAGYDEPDLLQPGRLPDGLALVGDLAARLDAPHETLGSRGLAEHVWHCSLSLPPDEAPRTDEQWRAIADRFVELMGFAGTDAEPDGAGWREGQAGCRWVAIHHGPSRNGNDHIHLVVTRATEDGRPVWLRYDKLASQRVADQVEDEFGLLKRCQRDAATAQPGIPRAQLEIAAQRGLPAPERDLLRTQVRAALAAATSEADWVTRMRRAGLLAAARTDKRTDPRFVHGYAVALPPPAGQKPRWYSGRVLDGDLSIVRARMRWPDQQPLSAAGWAAAKRSAQPGRTVGAGVRDRTATWRATADALDEVRVRLAGADPGAATWPADLRAVADMMARLAASAEPATTGPVSRAADALARAAAPRHPQPSSPPPPSTSVTAALRQVSRALAMLGPAGSAPEAALLLAVVVAATRIAMRVAQVRAARGELAAAGAAQAAALRLTPVLERAKRDGIHIPAPAPARERERPAPAPAADGARQKAAERDRSRDQGR